MLREHGIANTGEVRYALLELSGELGLVRYHDGEGGPGDSTLRTPSLQKQGVEA